MHSKEDLDDVCGDLFAIRVIAQSTGVPSTVRKQLRGSLKALLYKSAHYQEMASDGLIASKKLKLQDNEQPENTSESVHEKEEEKGTADTNAVEPMELNSSAENINKITTKQQETESEEKTVEEETDKKPKETNTKADSSTTRSLDTTLETDSTNAGADDEEDTGLMTACGPVFAANTLPQKEITKDVSQTESSSDEAGTQSYSINKTSNAASGSGLTVTLAKNANKKTAADRFWAEHEKRYKMLYTMETYIRSILTYMQKEEQNEQTNNTNENPEGENKKTRTAELKVINEKNCKWSDYCGEVDLSSSDESDNIDIPKSPSATPPPKSPSITITSDKVATTTSVVQSNKNNKDNEQILANGNTNDNEENVSNNIKDKNEKLSNDKESITSSIKIDAKETEEISSPISPAPVVAATTTATAITVNAAAHSAPIDASQI